jgi:secretion/DNA translocation related CpaE-like protein
MDTLTHRVDNPGPTPPPRARTVVTTPALPPGGGRLTSGPFSDPFSVGLVHRLGDPLLHPQVGVAPSRAGARLRRLWHVRLPTHGVLVPASPADHPLVVTADPRLLDDLLRLSAAADVEVEVAGDAPAARRAWGSAPLVLIGADLAVTLAQRPPPRREDVVLIGGDLDDAGIWERAVTLGAEHVAFLPDADDWLVDRLADAGERAGRRTGVLVVVVGGRGGAGASTLAAALGVTAVRRGHRALLVDADPLGGGLDLVLGGEDTAGLRWPELAGTRGRIAGDSLTEALPTVDGLVVLSWDRSSPLLVDPAALSSVLSAGTRAHDIVLVDLPRSVDVAAEEALSRCDVALLVVPAEVRATASAARVAAAVGAFASRVEVIVRGPAPGGLPADFVAASLGLPLAGSVRAEPGLAAALERGEAPARNGRGPLARLCGHLLADLLGSSGTPARAA